MLQVDLFSSPTHPPVSHCDCCRIAKFVPNLIAVRQWTQCGIVYSSYSYRFSALLQQIFFKFLAFLYTPVLHQQQIVYTGYAASALSKIIYTFSAMAALSALATRFLYISVPSKIFFTYSNLASLFYTGYTLSALPKIFYTFSALTKHFLHCCRFSADFQQPVVWSACLNVIMIENTSYVT